LCGIEDPDDEDECEGDYVEKPPSYHFGLRSVAFLLSRHQEIHQKDEEGQRINYVDDYDIGSLADHFRFVLVGKWSPVAIVHVVVEAVDWMGGEVPTKRRALKMMSSR
jgi:hypothetical protein